MTKLNKFNVGDTVSWKEGRRNLGCADFESKITKVIRHPVTTLYTYLVEGILREFTENQLEMFKEWSNE